MIRSLSVALLLACSAGPALAQLRAIPADARRATMSHVEGMLLLIDGRRLQMAAGGQIRDGRNMIVVPAAVPSGVLVKYLLDAEGRVGRVWILSPQEAEQPDPKK